MAQQESGSGSSQGFRETQSKRTGDALEDAHDADGGEVEGREVARHASLQEHAQQEQRRRPAHHLRAREPKSCPDLLSM